MNSSSNRGYCLWVVPPNEGKVRKFRFTLRRVIATLVIAMLTGGMFVYMLGDYARLQLLRIENYLSLSRLNSEHQKLIHSNESLRTQVTTLKSAQNKNANYQQDVKERLELLASVIESATALGVFEKGSVNGSSKKRASAKDGLGGAEIDCNSTQRFAECRRLMSGNDTKGSDLLSLSSTTQYSQADLVAQLDRYIEALKVIPFGLPAQGDLSSPFGVRLSPFTHTVRMHEGLDFSLSRGSNIYASAYGTVKSIQRNSTYGLVVDIEHNGRLVTRYAHLSRVLVKEGQKVSRGDVIALAGSSGLSTGPHLHFEVLVDGRPRDPSRFLALAKQLKVLI
ncbi:MAG: M23 family metallopeptidase [Deltaproteobacteria bacterium]|nr:M23 family metallopeptidase [Deltaproteobacteria bacterium]